MSDYGNVISFDTQEYGRPPLPSSSNPFAQVEWIFNKRKERANKISTKENYQSAKIFYIQHLKLTEGMSSYYLYDKWDEFSLLLFKDSIQKRIDEKELKVSSFTLCGYFSAVRQTMMEAASYGLLKVSNIQNVSWGSAYSETDAHDCYSAKELTQILDSLAEELRFTYKVANGYRKQCPTDGKDPRIFPHRSKAKGYGFGHEANMLWYFENILKCKPIVGVGQNKKEHKAFLTAATNCHGGLHQLYRNWGVSAFIDDSLLMPLAINLLYLTGLNPSSLLNLKVDCFREVHPLTGMSYLLFEKERSEGEKELHLPLLEKREERGLIQKQTKHVKRIITTIINLTEKLRLSFTIDDPRRHNLFIHESVGQRTFEKVLTLSEKRTSSWCRKMVERYNLLNDKGGALNFNLVRFRSTKLTEMALEGRDFFEIQQVARHKSISQTVHYISVNQLDTTASKVVSKALEQIRDNQNEIADKSANDLEQTQNIHLYKGLIADCKNVFNPPESVKRSIDYVEGQVCTRFNMCLFCRNVVIFKEHLPSLVAYRAEILISKGNNKLQNLPHFSHYDQTLDVLENLLNPETSQFTTDEIEWAFDMATSLDIVVDPLMYRGFLK